MEGINWGLFLPKRVTESGEYVCPSVPLSPDRTTFIHAYIHTYVFAFIHTYLHIHTKVHTYAYTHVQTCGVTWQAYRTDETTLHLLWLIRHQ